MNNKQTSMTSFFIPHTQKSSQNDDIVIKLKIVIILEDNIGENICKRGIGKFIIHMSKDLYPEYTKNSYKSIAER